MLTRTKYHTQAQSYRGFRTIIHRRLHNHTQAFTQSYTGFHTNMHRLSHKHITYSHIIIHLLSQSHAHALLELCIFIRNIKRAESYARLYIVIHLCRHTYAYLERSRVFITHIVPIKTYSIGFSHKSTFLQ